MERSVVFTWNMNSDLSATPARPAMRRAIRAARVRPNGSATQAYRPRLPMVFLFCVFLIPNDVFLRFPKNVEMGGLCGGIWVSGN